MDENETLSRLMDTVNIAEDLTEDQLTEIGEQCKTGFDTDLDSRHEWEKCVDEWMKLAKQTVEAKNFPWPKASNIKYPLLSTAAMQFAARAYPSLIPSDGRVVKARIVGKDPSGEKTMLAEAISLYMSYQLMEEMDGWEADMDRLLLMLPIVGTVFKKTYWDSITEKNCSKLVLPKNLVVNYWTRDLKTAERISEILELNPRKVKERQNAGLWLDIELGDATVHENEERGDNAPSNTDETTPYSFIEQHRYLDLDEDDYPEPYIVTFHRTSGKVVRIVANYDDTTVKFDDKGDVLSAEPIHYYTKYGFIPNPDGGFYDIGFGTLIAPINESANTLINQLVDAGTLRNLQGGFLGKGLRLRMGETRFQPGEWKVVNSTGDDIKKQIVPLPANEPSKVLLDLLQLLIQSGKELASVAEIFVGKMPGQNTPATTTMATIEQGMKVFTAVYKRLYRSMQEEFDKLYRLNSIYLNDGDGEDIIGMGLSTSIFDGTQHKIVPGADPTAVSQTEKLMKAQGLMEMLAAGLPLDPLKVMVRMLEAQEQPNWQELIPQEIMQSGQIPQRPDPKMMEMQMKGQLEQQKIQMQGAAQQQKMELERRSEEQKLMMQQMQHEQEMQHKAQMNNQEAALAFHKQRIFSAEAQAKATQNLRHSEESHQQSLRQGEEAGAAKVQQMKQQQAAKPKKEPTKK